MAVIPGFNLFNGATMSRVVDGSGAVWRGFCGKAHVSGQFGFFITRNDVSVPYAPFCTARGCVTPDGYWTAWQDNAQYFEGPLPGFVPRPSVAALEQRIAQLEATIAHLPPTVSGPVLSIPASGGLEGGEVQLASGDGGPPLVIDVRGGHLRIVRGGVVLARWPA